MISDIVELEKKLFYRLVKVFYIFFLMIFLSAMFFSGYSSIPQRYVDDERSYLVCENGIYPFKNLGIHFWTEKGEIVSNNFDKKADRVCSGNDDSAIKESGQITPEIARAELKRREMIRQPNHPVYVLSPEFITEGGWFDVFCWWFLGSGITYITLSVIRDTLIYVAFGKKFTWDWLKKPYYFCRIKYLTVKNRVQP